MTTTMMIWDIISIRMKIFTELNTCNALTLRYFPDFTWVNKIKKKLKTQVVSIIALHSRADMHKETVNLNRVCISYCINVKDEDVSVHTMWECRCASNHS